MAHKMTGVILVLVATLRSTEGRKAILDAKNDTLGTDPLVAPWEEIAI
jgi:hypothetical protein